MKNSKTKSTLLRICVYLKKYRIYFVGALICAAIYVAMTLYVPILVGHAVDCIVYKNVDFPAVISLIRTIICVTFIAGISQYLMNVMNNKMGYLVVRDIRNDLMAKIQKLPIAYLDANPSGTIVSRMIADVDQFADGLLMGFTQLFTGIITILGTLCFMFSMNPIIALLVVVLTPASMFMAKFITSKTYNFFHEQSEIRGRQTAIIDEMLGNIKVVKAFSHEKEVLCDFNDVNSELRTASLKAIFFSSLTNPTTRFVNAVVYALVALFGAFVVIGGQMSVGILASFLSYATQYTKPFNEITGVITELQNALACAARVFEILDAKEEETDCDGELKNVEGKVDIKDVSFSYSEDTSLIENLNLEIKPGMRVAIVGPTGCGKTTIINLLMRFFDTDKGTILVDNNSIKEVSRKSLRNSYGMVLQDTWLRSGTIAENISMGKKNVSMDSIINAAKETHAHSFIRRLPSGYDTVISEDGGQLSQGQKQLLCITRVMLNIPPMLILDEATSSIDTRTEAKIQNAFRKMMEGRTSFIVAHRLSTIVNSDIILVMKNGSIIEQGTHAELLARKGFYSELYNAQFEN